MFRIVSSVTENTEAILKKEKVKNPLDESSLEPTEIIVRIEACPINPSDVGVLCPAGTDEDALSTVRSIPNGLAYQINKKFSPLLSPRVNHFVAVGNEGAGVVVKAGSHPDAQRLLHKVVSLSVGGMYSQYKKTTVSNVLLHETGTSVEQAASSFVNPMTVLCMIETMKREGHCGMVHTAAASQLGLMLQKYCLKENIPLINVVRKEEQEKVLLGIGAKFVVRSDKDSFVTDLADIVAKTKVTLVFDAIGGGSVTSNVLTAMELGAKRFAPNFDPSSPYGTSVHKQVYIYGGLDKRPTVLSRGYGFSWGISSFLMPNVLLKLPKPKVIEMKRIIVENIATIFKTEYYKTVSLDEMVMPETFLEYVKQTGKKFLVLPHGPGQQKL